MQSLVICLLFSVARITRRRRGSVALTAAGGLILAPIPERGPDQLVLETGRLGRVTGRRPSVCTAKESFTDQLRCDSDESITKGSVLFELNG